MASSFHTKRHTGKSPWPAPDLRGATRLKKLPFPTSLVPEATGDFPEYRWPTSHLKAIFIEYVEQRAEFHCPSPHGFVSGFSDGAPIWAHGHPSVRVSPKIHWFKTSCSHHVHIMCAINSGHNLECIPDISEPLLLLGVQLIAEQPSQLCWTRCRWATSKGHVGSPKGFEGYEGYEKLIKAQKWRTILENVGVIFIDVFVRWVYTTLEGGGEL